MRGLPFAICGLAALAALALGVSALSPYGRRRWAAATRELHARLEASRPGFVRDGCVQMLPGLPVGQQPRSCWRGRVGALQYEFAP